MSTGNNHPEGAGHPGPGDATTQTTNPPGGGERPDVVATLGGEGSLDVAMVREQVASAMRILAVGVLDGALPWEDCARVIRLLAGAIAPKGE